MIEDLNKRLQLAIDQVLIEHSIEKLAINPKTLNFEASLEEKHGDFSTSCPMKLAKVLKKNPEDIAKLITDKLNKANVEKISVIKPGYINVVLPFTTKIVEIRQIIQGNQKYGTKTSNGCKALVEFVSSNPTGPLHVGHGRGAVLGLAISNLLETQGYKVSKEYYVNDAGRQIDILALSVLLTEIDESIPKDGLYLGSYIKILASELSKIVNVSWSTPSEELPKEQEKKLDFLIDHFKKQDFEMWNQIKEFCVNEMLKLIKIDMKNFSINFDSWFKESSVGSINNIESNLFSALKKIRDKGLTYNKDGALWFKTTDFGDDKDRVLLRENGEPTYLLTDVGYHKNKLDRNYDMYLNIFGADHHGYLTRIESAFSALSDNKKRLDFVLYQLVNLFEDGKKKQMSTRKGQYEILAELERDIGADVIKFFFLEKKSDNTIDFDLTLAKENSKNNPYFYVQYAHVRCSSILEKAEIDLNVDLNEKEILSNHPIIARLINYPLFLERYANELSPHSLVNFVKELAAAFHSFYESSPVLIDNKIIANTRLVITKACKIVLSNALQTLGVKPLDKM